MQLLPNAKAIKERKLADFYKGMLHYEAKVGGQLFGPIPDGNRREFFCLDEHTWVWHEEWKDANGAYQMLTTRYDIRPSGIVKSQGGRHYQALSPQETQNICQAIEMYADRMAADIPRLAAAQ